MSASQVRELYVYYRVADANAVAAAHSVDDLQRRLRDAHPGLVARRLRRPASADGEQTWMETYALPGRGIDAALQARIAEEAHVLDRWIVGARHVEVFAAADG